MEEVGWRRNQDGLNVGDQDKHSLKQITGIREQIDELDQSISLMLAQRLTLARQLTKAKAYLGLPIQDNSREMEVLKKVAAPCGDSELAQAVKTVYQSIMAQSRQLQSESALDCNVETVPSAEKLTGERKQPGKTPLYFPRVLIVGLGLIGGALARQIKRTAPQTVVIGVDRPEIVGDALSQGIIDVGETDLVCARKKTQLIVLAASPDQNLMLLEELAPHLHRRQLVVDVTSTKSHICKLAERLNLRGADFIGGHPFFGSEKSGLSGSLELNPEGKLFCLVPTARSSEISLRRLSRWLIMLKFKVEITDATTHDITSARLSHIVQLLAVTLGAEISEGLSEQELKKVLRLSGPSFAQTARLMASPSKLWTEIISQNRDAISEALSRFDKRLKDLRKAIKTDDRKALEQLFKAAGVIPKTFQT